MKGEKTIDELKEQLEPEPELVHLRQENADLRRKIDDMRSDQGYVTTLIKDVIEAVEPLKSMSRLYETPDYQKEVSKPVSATLHLTDWHTGMVQEPDEIEGFNEFNFTIQSDRVLNQLVPTFIDWVTVQRKVQIINECRVLATGDMISGDIHHELQVTNEFPAPVQVAKGGFLMADALLTLAPHFDKVIIDYVSADNHGRLERKPQAKQEGLNTFNYLVGIIASQRLAEVKNLEFNIYPQLYKSIKIQKTRYLLTHGHSIKMWMGIPWYGIERQIGREAQVRMNAPESVKFHKVVLGHFHTPMNNPKFMMGGSLSGTDAYDRQNGRESPPCQTAWLVHPVYGDYNWTAFKLN